MVEKIQNMYYTVGKNILFTIYLKCESACIFGLFFYDHTIWLHNCYTGKIGLLNSRTTRAPCFILRKKVVKGSSIAWLKISYIEEMCKYIFLGIEE